MSKPKEATENVDDDDCCDANTQGENDVRQSPLVPRQSPHGLAMHPDEMEDAMRRENDSVLFGW